MIEKTAQPYLKYIKKGLKIFFLRARGYSPSKSSGYFSLNSQKKDYKKNLINHFFGEKFVGILLSSKIICFYNLVAFHV
jgi:hypothetical protein